jgi:integral membrane protein
MPACPPAEGDQPPARAAAVRTERARLERGQLRRLEVASLVEAATLVLLVVVAVPLKHAAGWPLGVRLMGPVHGLAFLAYLYAVVETVAGGGWTVREIARLVVVAFVPFGALANLELLRRKQAALVDSPRLPA